MRFQLRAQSQPPKPGPHSPLPRLTKSEEMLNRHHNHNRCHNSASGDSAFQGLLLSLAAFISAMNSQLFVFVQLNPGLFMTVYHGGNLAKSPPHYWVSQINDIQCQSWVKQ